MAPGFQPYSALGICCVLNSWMASMGTMEVASPKIGVAFTTLCDENPSTVSMLFRI
jgi:hypothetical protein